MCLQSLIKVYDLGFGYTDKRLFSGLSFEIFEGEFFCMAGANGAGKSTLLKLLAGILKPQAGKIIFKGRAINSIPIKQLAKMRAVVDQNPVFEFISVEDFVALGRIAYFKPFQIFQTDEDKRAVKEALSLCNIQRVAQKRMDEISGGERQLAFIARAIVQNSGVLFLDEPFSNLDIANTIEILLLLKKLNRNNNATIIAVLHDLNIALRVCDRVMLLKNGQLKAVGKPGDILKKDILNDVYGSDKITVTQTENGELCVSFLI
ncbi:ABC transporter ATP-binding protein [Hippea jasoniae]|uniref:ABC transporter ATP-binding protein n=1 Tax=Hippea jasoniae TaxID=944479 RepID=UPI00055775AD|nr:ABC transporter ATP-binding protein [Hippea jasoniae]